MVVIQFTVATVYSTPIYRIKFSQHFIGQLWRSARSKVTFWMLLARRVLAVAAHSDAGGASGSHSVSIRFRNVCTIVIKIGCCDSDDSMTPRTRHLGQKQSSALR
jgi:hypothetical protein